MPHCFTHCWQFSYLAFFRFFISRAHWFSSSNISSSCSLLTSASAFSNIRYTPPLVRRLDPFWTHNAAYSYTSGTHCLCRSPGPVLNTQCNGELKVTYTLSLHVSWICSECTMQQSYTESNDFNIRHALPLHITISVPDLFWIHNVADYKV